MAVEGQSSLSVTLKVKTRGVITIPSCPDAMSGWVDCKSNRKIIDGNKLSGASFYINSVD